MEDIVELLKREFQASTTASESDCDAVARRLATEVDRICTESQRIQRSGEVEAWQKNLARHRLNQCLRYYKAGSRRGRTELHGTLSAIVYRYISPPRSRASYQARLGLIEDFLQNFYVESLSAFRRETGLPEDYCPRTSLQLAEYMAFSERYAKRRIPLSRGRSQQLIVLRARTFSNHQPPETAIDMDRASEGGSSDGDAYTWDDASVQAVRDRISSRDRDDAMDEALRTTIVRELMEYLESRNQQACIDYLVLRLSDLPASEIEQILGLTARQRDYLQQRFKYHLIRFALLHRWELVHQWLDADLERDLGLTPRQWAALTDRLDDTQARVLALKREGLDDAAIARELGINLSQAQKHWFKLLEVAWDLRNQSMSGTGESTDE